MAVPDAPLADWDICINEISKLVELPCTHKCCVECVRRIDKRHMRTQEVRGLQVSPQPNSSEVNCCESALLL
jgi:hypothetical protein